MQPKGCSQANTGIVTFKRIGSTWSSRSATAHEVQQQMHAALIIADPSAQIHTPPSGTVSYDIYVLFADFGDLESDATMADGSAWDNLYAQTNMDIRTLNGACGVS
jgi:hypothetical protein